jgi:threonine synthase
MSHYVSTRGGAAPVGFFDAMLAGLAPDGGLYAPQAWPQLRAYLREAGGRVGYVGAAAEVLHLFAGADLSFAGAAETAEAVYGPAGRFSHPAVAPLKQIDSDVWLMELFHGPSLAFKDVALQLIASLYDRALRARGGRLSVVCATSGDTGGAAVEALKGQERIDLFVLLPRGRVSDVQRRFMTASGADNVHALEVDTDFDGCQALVKGLFADEAFSGAAQLSGVNSINWARIVAQAAYFVRAAYALCADGPVNFVIPTGNFGDALSAHVARAMGAPVGRVLIATNANDMLAATVETGLHARQGASRATVSPAMDILAPSNFERLVFDLTGADATRGFYQRFAQSGAAELDASALAGLRAGFSAERASDAETLEAIRQAYRRTGEILCPHTAAGAAAAMKAQAAGHWPPPHGATVLLATAHPAKFPDTVEHALGVRPGLPERCADLFEREERITPMTADLAALKQLIGARSRAFQT